MSTALRSSTSALSEPQRLLIALLNQQLADAIDLGLQAKQAHWNVKGPHFTSLHLFFDEIADMLSDLIDALAERVIQLGGVADGTLQAVVASSRLPVYGSELLAGGEHVRALSRALALFAASTRAAIDTATAQGDATTADVFTEVSRGVDELLWKLTAHGPITG